ncbi:hypothetical protein BOX15_Mlig004283g1 [Macrostomum lignano]|uniref:alanine transaminase n=1 Tax=Macrostomum lignano TaxID=282301 RepID=A0A267FEE7_9PLAT|nr:hypothetical protein BOX15_Mlig004283g1 [Macrostomum lignano]
MAASVESASLAGQSQQADKGESKPLTYLRQVLALMLDPGLLARSGAGCYPADVVAMAKRLLAEFPGASLGSYTHTGGQFAVRQLCADFLARRDGGASQVDDVMVTCGSAEAVRLLLEGFGRRQLKPAAALIPAPGRPMYAAFAHQVGVLPVPYRLTAPLTAGWQLAETELEAAYRSAVEAGGEPRILVLLNPGRPTGQLLTAASLQLAADFARRRRLFVISDETLQFAQFDNEQQFVKFRRLVLEQQAARPDLPPLEVASVTSLSEASASNARNEFYSND